jgi:glycosyltransferase involved in cell wall biosynthesis
MEHSAVHRLKMHQLAHERAIFSSSSVNPIIELLGLLQLIWLMLKFKPDIVHCASPKGILYGGIAARICGVRALVLAISGMGYAYTTSIGQNGGRVWIRRIHHAMSMLAFHHPNVRVIVQNRDDYQSTIDRGLSTATEMTLIPGSGVELSRFVGCVVADKENIVLLPARMLKDKGVVEFVEAARRIKTAKPSWRFLLAGAADYDNPSAIAEDCLRTWQAEGSIEWLGHLDDMVQLYRDAAIVCLPSYREGMPKSLLEAAAAGCAVVTTDVPGCREAIEPGITGDMVPAGNSKALEEVLLSLINDPKRRVAYGIAGQKRAKKLFSIDSVIEQTLDIYKAILRDD